MNKKVKISSILLISFGLFVATLFSIGFLVNKQVNVFISNLADTVSKQVGNPVSFGKVTTKWSWLHLKITINDILIKDQENNVPICGIKTVIGVVDAYDTIASFQVKFKNLIIQSPRLALQWDGINQVHLAGLKGSAASSTSVDPMPLLYFLALQKRVTIENGDLHIQGRHGADLPLMNVKLDFKKLSNFEYHIISRGSVAAAVQPEFNLAAHYHGSLDNLSNYMIDFEVKTSNVQLQNLLNLMHKYHSDSVVGNFQSLDFKGAIQDGKLGFLNSDFIISHIELGKDLKIPTGSGHIEYRPDADKISFSGTNIQVQHDKLFNNPIMFDEISGNLINQQVDNFNEMQTEDITFKLVGMELKPKISASWNTEKIEKLEFVSDLQNAHLTQVVKLLPDRKLPARLTSWLNTALIDGSITKAKFKYDLGKPYLQMEFLNTEIKYSTDWPSVHGIDATLVLDGDQIMIDATKADILGNKINSVTVEFMPAKNDPYAIVMINGDMNTNLAAGIHYLNQSPLQAMLGSKLSQFKPNGPMHLALAFNVKLNNGDPIVDTFADIKLDQVSLQVPNINVPITGVTGDLHLSPKGLAATDVDLTIMGYKTTARVGLDNHKSKELQIGFKLPFKVADLKQFFPELKLDQVVGASNAVVDIKVPWQNANADKIVSLTSNMVGISLDYPPPFKKTAQEKWPLQIKYFIKDSPDRTVYLKVSNWLDANLFVKNSKLSGGHISFGSGKAILASQDTMLISGRMANFIWEDWQPWIAANKGMDTLPIEVDLLFDNLIFRGQKYASMWVKYESKANRFILDSPIVSGAIQIAKDQEKIDFKLSKLIFESDKNGSGSMLEQVKQNNKNKTLPLIQFYCENLRYNKQSFRKVSLQLLPRTYGYEISDLSLSNDNLLLQAQGQWQMDNKEYTQLSGNAYTKNLGKVLHEFGYPTSITKGKGELNFTLQWDGDPAQVNLLKLDGNSHVELQSGNIESINPGLGRVIGLLSLEAIQRRLQLDFSDIINKGFTFDRLVSDIQMRPGVLASENIVIQSPSSRIELMGKSNLKGRELDFTMYVTPKVGVGLPVAAAIAIGNPAIGAALWLFDHASGLKISELTRYKYKITGTWDSPKIDEIVNNKTTNNAAVSAEPGKG